MAHLFCRDLCLARGEPMVGTGAFDDRVMLVAWPRGKWRVPRFESAGMEPVLGQAIRRAMQAGFHVALVDRVGETATLPALQVEGVAADFATQAELAGAIDRVAAGEALAGRADGRQVVLCCTDSRRDACCARYGFATYKALRDAADPARVNVLQCTHIGGCRFAASLLVPPRGERYGRLEPADAIPFLAALARGEIYRPAFRGRPDLAEPAQVAEHAAATWAAAHGLDAGGLDLGPQPWPAEPGAGAIERVVQAGPTRLGLSLATAVYPTHARCTALAEPAELTPRWRVLAIHPEPASPKET